MDERRRLERDIAALSWQEFQRLIHDLVKKEVPNALPLDPPDGGADTLIPRDGDRVKEVVQAKHYARPSRIKWSECRSSLEAALESHEPERITFAFSRNFTAKEERDFREKLVDPFPHVDVRVWTLDEIIDRLDRHPDLKKRYFGREHEETLDSILRAIEHGNKVETGADLIKRTHSLAVFAEEHDRDFTYVTSGGGASMREPLWEELPFMTMTVKDETTTVRVDAWARGRADVPPAAFSFTSDQEGREALGHAREQLARGHDAVLRSGLRFQVPKMPKAMKEAIQDEGFKQPEITIGAANPVTLELAIETSSETIARTFEVRPIPPLEPGHVAFGCSDGGLFVELDFLALEEPTVRFRFRMTGTFGRDVSANVEAARILDAFYNHERIVLRAERLFPDSMLEASFEAGTEDERQSMAMRRQVYDDLALIEERIGIDFTLPEHMGEVDLAAINTVARILETGEGTATFQQGDGIVEAHEIASIAERLPEERVIHRPVVYEVLGETLELGVGEYELPRLRVIDVRPLGATPESPAHVTIGPAGDDQMRFRLLAPKPPIF